MTTQSGSFLATRRGGLTLLLCAVQFLDVADSSIMNVALPSIRRDLGFSVQDLQWVLSGYLVTYGGLLLLGGRAGDLLGRRRLLAAGTGLFAAGGAVLATAGMLLLVYALVRAPQQGWASARTISELTAAGLALAAFAVTELRRRSPLFPFSIFRIRGLAAADATQMIAFAGFVSTFFFLTLYMQNILGYSPIRGGAAYLPIRLRRCGLTPPDRGPRSQGFGSAARGAPATSRATAEPPDRDRGKLRDHGRGGRCARELCRPPRPMLRSVTPPASLLPSWQSARQWLRPAARSWS